MSVRAMKAGAIDFLAKPFREQDMLDAVAAAIECDTRRRRDAEAISTLKSLFSSLTPREREVLAHVTSGLMNKQIAAVLGLSEITVKIHRGNLMRKMGAKSLADLVRKAEALGIATPLETGPLVTARSGRPSPAQVCGGRDRHEGQRTRRQDDQSGASGRGQPRRLHLGRARPSAGRAAPCHRRDQRHQRRGHERRGARPGLDAGRAARGQVGAGSVLAPDGGAVALQPGPAQPRSIACSAAGTWTSRRRSALSSGSSVCCRRTRATRSASIPCAPS